MLIARLQHLRDRRDAGITLIEMMIAMGLMSIIGTMSIYFFVGVNTASSQIVDANVSTAQARNTLQQWTTLLNFADSSSAAGTGTGRFTEITPTSTTFYSNVNDNRSTTSGTARTAPEKVTLSLENGTLVERDYSASSGSLVATRNLVSDVTRTNGAWLFTPHCAATSTTGSTSLGSCSSTSSGSSALATVARVDVAFTVTFSDGSTRAFTSSASISGSTS